jgi:hypothetical protein
MRARRIENLEALQLKASEIAQITVKELEARHYLVWWLSSYDRNMKRGYNNETICLSTYQVNEFCFSYAITSEVEKFYLLIQPENWFLNDLTFESASIDEKGLVLNLAEVNDQLFKLYISRMQIRFNLDEIHAERLTHAKKYAKELVFIQYNPQKNQVMNVGVSINLENNTITRKSSNQTAKNKRLKGGILMKKSNYFKVIGAIAVSTVVSLAYAGFTEINSSGDIVSKDSANALRTSFSTPNQNIPAPLRTYSLWDKISETTKYNGTVQPKPTPVAIESTSSQAQNIQSKSNINVANIESQQEIKRLQAALKEKETENNKLKYSNLEMQVQVVELKSDINELKQQVNFLASQMQIVESDVLVMKNKKPSSF